MVQGDILQAYEENSWVERTASSLKHPKANLPRAIKSLKSY
jgi:hypothetical protein